jgi:hypothetical protein
MDNTRSDFSMMGILFCFVFGFNLRFAITPLQTQFSTFFSLSLNEIFTKIDYSEDDVFPDCHCSFDTRYPGVLKRFKFFHGKRFRPFHDRLDRS